MTVTAALRKKVASIASRKGKTLSVQQVGGLLVPKNRIEVKRRRLCGVKVDNKWSTQTHARPCRRGFFPYQRITDALSFLERRSLPGAFASALSFAAADSLSVTFPLYLCCCIACCDARASPDAVHATTTLALAPPRRTQHGYEARAEHLPRSRVVIHTHLPARIFVHAPTLALPPTPHTTMASLSPRWLLSRDESIGQKFEEVMNNNPLGASVRMRVQRFHIEHTDTAQG